MRSTLLAASFALLVASAGHSVAQTPAAPAGTPSKAALSKSCSTQADAKGLHGKARKRFRSACKQGKS